MAAADAALCPVLLPTVVMLELPLVNEMGDEAVFVRLWLELPLTKDVGDDTVLMGLLLKSPLVKDTGDELVLVMQLRSLCLILLVKDAGDDLLVMTELELVALTDDELALTKSDGFFDHSFIIALLSFLRFGKINICSHI